jgi:hypothetical protein
MSSLQTREEIRANARATLGLLRSEQDRPTPPEAPPTQQSVSTERRVRLTAASAIKVRPVRWLWDERLPLAAIALLGGREGVGKSIFAYTMTADITRGRLRGVYFGEPKSVIVAATEDSWEHTLCPRLMAAGADLNLVFRVDVVTGEDTDGWLSLPKDLPEVEHLAKESGAALLILDPLMSRLDPKLDSHKDADVRRALEPLAAMADATAMCILGLIHVNKSASSDPLTTLMASRAFAAVARAVLFVMTDPDDESVRLLGQAKNNLGRMDLPTLTFTIEGSCVAETAEGAVWTGKLHWLADATRSIREAMEATTAAFGDRTATTEAADWLHDYLLSKGGTCDSALVKKDGKAAGHSADTLKRARKQIGVAYESRGFPRRSFWSLPPQSEQPVGAASGETALTALTAPTDINATQLAQSAQLERLEQAPRPSAPTVRKSDSAQREDTDAVI